MKILIIGNIGCGKTTLGEALREKLGYKFVQIDEIRSKYITDKKVSLEYLSLYHFIRAIEEYKDVILEFTGVGCHKYAIIRALELTGDSVLVIICKTNDLNTLKKRIQSKQYGYKNPFDIDINKHIEFIQREIENDISSGFWRRDKIKEIVFDMNERNMDEIIDAILIKLRTI